MQSVPQFVRLPGGIEQDRANAVTRIPVDAACPARTQVHKHLMLLSVVDRSQGDSRADVLVYSLVERDGDHFYVNALDAKHATGECPRKPLAFDIAAECEAEAEAARQLLRRDRVK